ASCSTKSLFFSFNKPGQTGAIMLRRILCCLPLCAMLLALTACGGSNTSAPKANGDGQTPVGPPLYNVVDDKSDPGELAGSGLAADPILVPDCRLTYIDSGKNVGGKADVPSRYYGVLHSLSGYQCACVKICYPLAHS